MKYKHRRTGIRRKYKRLAAAVAGAAIMSSAMLPGIPAVRAYAVNPDSGFASVTAVQPVASANFASDPVQTVTANAATYGFDAAGSGFALLSQTGDNAVVRVRSCGQAYNVDLEKQGEGWVIKTIRGIGDARHPATFIPAGMFPLAATTTVPAGPAAIPATLPGSQQVLFQTNNFTSWQWNDTTMPQDMAFGLFVRDPRQGDSAAVTPGAALNPLNNVDFTRQFVVYAHLGTTAAQGYGIGIASVIQTGDNLTITIRTKSPQPNAAATPTKTDDFVPLDRSGLDFASPIHVNFVTPSGVSLFSYTLNPG